MKTQPRWFKGSSITRFPKMARDITVDVAIIGGGMTGISAGHFLKKAGVKVAVVEKNRIGTGETGNTTAHLTYVTDPRLTRLAKTFGKENAKSVWDGTRYALDVIQDIVQEEEIECDFARVPGFLHLPREESIDLDLKAKLKAEAALAQSLGFEASFVDSAPVVNRPAIRFPNQGQFHPLKYLSALARTVSGDGSYVFEHSEATEFTKDPFKIKINGHTLTCNYIVVATHVPILGETNLLTGTLFQSKITGYSSYAIGAKLPKGSVNAACYWDTNDPYDYIRIDTQPTHDYVIYGGNDHKTGQETSAESRFERVEAKLLSLFPKAKVHSRWSGQVIQTNDALPLIGEIVPGQFIATGFIGNGILFGTLAGVMARDAYLQRKNKWIDLFSVRRKTFGATWDFIKENADFPYYLVKDRLKVLEDKKPAALARGEGKILKVDGQKLACYRDEHGTLHKVSAACTHLGCLVHWNDAEKTWDCPCHGSRFKPTGEVIAGPAETPLEPIKESRQKETNKKAKKQLSKPRVSAKRSK